MPKFDHVIYLVDDDPAVRTAVREMLIAAGYSCETFASGTEYLKAAHALLPACLVLDVGLPDINGLDLQCALQGANRHPIVFITGRGDIPSSVRAIRHGAIDFLQKPFNEMDLLDAVNRGLKKDRRLLGLRTRLSSLTPREQQVLPLVVAGLLNKQAADVLGISQTTLQIHRGRIMRKMAADSLADLVRMASLLRIQAKGSRRPRHPSAKNGADDARL